MKRTESQKAHPASQQPPFRAGSVAASTVHSRIYSSIGAPTNLMGENVQRLTPYRKDSRNVGKDTSRDAGRDVGRDNERNVVREEGKVNVKMVLTSFGYKDPDPDDRSLVTIFRQIEERHSVIIAPPTGNGILSIKAHSLAEADQAVQGIRFALQSQGSDSDAWHPQILIAPTVGLKDNLEVQLEKAETGARPVRSLGPDSHVERVKDKVQLLDKEFLDAFQNKMFPIAESLRSNPSETHMRVRFGTLRLQEWKKDKDTYSYADLATLARRVGLRGTYKLDEFLGPGQYNEDLMTKICSMANFFEPVTTRIASLVTVPAKHSLILRTLTLDLETEMIHVLDNDQKTSKYRLGPVRGYRREKRNQAVEITTACLEWRHDWDLQVRTQVKVESLPFTHRDLEANTRFVANSQSGRFPEVHIFKDFATRSKLEDIVGKTSSIFRITNTPYQVEISLFQRWPGSTTREPTIIGCGATMRGADWDEQLGPKNIAEGHREWSDDFAELFPPADGQSGLEVFLRCVQEIHHILGEVAGFQCVEDPCRTLTAEAG